jgi:hypothetical protein
MKKIAFIITLCLLVHGSVTTVHAQRSGTIPGCTDAQCDVNYSPSPFYVPPSTTTGTTTTTGSTTTTTPDPAPTTTAQCSSVTYGNYNECCTADGSSSQCQTIKNRCDTLPRPLACDELFSATINAPGTAGSGAQPTGAINNTNNGSGGAVIANTPQSGSAELAGCSAIKFKSILDLLIWVKCIIVAALIPLIFAAAFLFFLWGVLRFMAATDSTKKEESKKFIMWGIVALFVMVSLWGIIKILGQTLGVESTVPLLQTESLDIKKASR